MTTELPHQSDTGLLRKVQGLFLGAAIGDALGWPQEFLPSRSGGRGRKRLPLEPASFRKWTRRTGGRYWAPHEEIQPGEYSDDTQLLLCSARSLRLGATWWRHFTMRELPTWLLYERGGGRATKDAAKSWLSGVPPWSARSTQSRNPYFDAGGNGVAMRIAPHSARGVEAASFAPIAASLIADGICSHGHPRALVGALAYGFAIWTALRMREKLPYGGLVDALLNEKHVWARLPSAEDLERAGMPSDAVQDWRRSVDDVQLEPGGSYVESWEEVVDETVLALRRCREALEDGPMADNTQLLRELGCFDRNRNGAGTVSAAAAIYLASAFAADPLNGIIEAAFAYGADTDTLASMTGGLLGAINGTDRFGALADEVQDAAYLRNIAESLFSVATTAPSADASDTTPTRHVSRKDLDRITDQLKRMDCGENIALPDGRHAAVLEVKPLSTGSPTMGVVLWGLGTDDGQRLYVSKVDKVQVGKVRREAAAPAEPWPVASKPLFDTHAGTLREGPTSGENGAAADNRLRPPAAVLMGVVLPIEDIRRTREFYTRVLGLAVSQARNGSLRLGTGVSFRPTGSVARVATGSATRADHDGSHELRLANAPELNLQTDELDAAYQRVVESGTHIVDELAERGGRRTFRCIDPDGYLVQMYEEYREAPFPDLVLRSEPAHGHPRRRDSKGMQ